MPTWLLLALAAALTWAVVNLIDKFIIERIIQSPVTAVILDSVISAVFATIAWIVLWHSVPAATAAIPALLSGILMALFTLSYFNALKYMDASVIAVLVQLAPLLSVIAGVGFFSESLQAEGGIGVGLVITGCLLATVEQRGGFTETASSRAARSKRYSALLVLGLGTIVLTTAYVLQKVSVEQLDPFGVFALSRLGTVAIVPALLMDVNSRSELPYLMLRVTRREPQLLTLLATVLLNMFAAYLMIKSYDSGPFSFVVPAASTQPLFAIFLTVPLKALWLEFPDHSTKQNMWTRTLAAVMVIIGVYLLSQTRPAQ